MILKHNDATHNRPGGDRILDAPSLLIDVPAYINIIRNEEEWQRSDRNSITAFKSADMTIVVGGLHKGAEMLPHKAEGMMSIQVLKGTIEINIDDTAGNVTEGQVIAIHKGCNYRIVAAEEALYLLTITNVG